MTMLHSRLAELVRRDPRYPYEAYEFLYAALAHTQQQLGRVPPEDGPAEPEARYHVTGQELLAGACDLARREFGLMARTVFRMWGINRTDDFGELVFNLIDENLMSKTENDRREDFHNLFDLDVVLLQDYRIQLDEAEGRP